MSEPLIVLDAYGKEVGRVLHPTTGEESLWRMIDKAAKTLHPEARVVSVADVERLWSNAVITGVANFNVGARYPGMTTNGKPAKLRRTIHCTLRRVDGEPDEPAPIEAGETIPPHHALVLGIE